MIQQFKCPTGNWTYDLLTTGKKWPKWHWRMPVRRHRSGKVLLIIRDYNRGCRNEIHVFLFNHTLLHRWANPWNANMICAWNECTNHYLEMIKSSFVKWLGDAKHSTAPHRSRNARVAGHLKTRSELLVVVSAWTIALNPSYHHGCSRCVRVNSMEDCRY